MTQRFEKAFNSLVRAFFEGTLAKASCTACACGNIIFDAVGDPMTKEYMAMEIEDYSSGGVKRDEVLFRGSKAYDLWTNKRSMCFPFGYKALPGYANEVNVAGYTAEEFAKIETAFEDNTYIFFWNYPINSEQAILEDQYKGLCAVVDVLLKLDESNENPDELKAKFREHPKLVAA